MKAIYIAFIASYHLDLPVHWGEIDIIWDIPHQLHLSLATCYWVRSTFKEYRS